MWPPFWSLNLPYSHLRLLGLPFTLCRKLISSNLWVFLLVTQILGQMSNLQRSCPSQPCLYGHPSPWGQFYCFRGPYCHLKFTCLSVSLFVVHLPKPLTVSSLRVGSGLCCPLPYPQGLVHSRHTEITVGRKEDKVQKEGKCIGRQHPQFSKYVPCHLQILLNLLLSGSGIWRPTSPESSFLLSSSRYPTALVTFPANAFMHGSHALLMTGKSSNHQQTLVKFKHQTW